MKLETVNIIISIIIVILLLVLALKGDEQFRRIDDQKCQSYTNQLCNQMKSSEYGTTGDPATLSSMMQYCGKDTYPNVQSCYPSWALTQGGNWDNLFSEVLDTPVTNPMY